MRSILSILEDLRPKTDYVIVLVISVVQVSLWFGSRSLPAGANSPPIPQPKYFVDHYLYAWNAWIDNGNPIPLTIFFPVYSVAMSLLMTLGLSYPDSLRLFVILWLFVGGLSIYELSKLLIDEKQNVNVRAASLIASAFYAFSFYWITIAEEIPTGVMTAASIPLLLYSFAVALKKNSLRHSLLAGIALFIMGQNFPGSAALFIISSIAITVVSVSFVFSKRTRKLPRLFSLLRTSSIVLIVFISTSMYWIITFLIAQRNYLDALNSNVPSFFPEPQFLAMASSPINAIRLIPWTWFTDTLNPGYVRLYANPLVQISTFVLPAAALCSLLVRLNRRTALFACLTAFVVFLTMGSTTVESVAFWHPLVTLSIGKIMYNSSITGLLAPFIVVGYATLGGIFLGWVLKASKAGRAETTSYVSMLQPERLARMLFVFAIILLVMISVVPIYSGQIEQWHAQSYSGNGVNLPSYYERANDWFSAHEKGGGSVFVAPDAGVWPTLQWGGGSGYQGINPYPELLSSIPVITGVGYSYGASSSDKQLISLAYSSIQDPTLLLSQLGPCISCDNLAGNSTNWSTNPGYRDTLRWDNSQSFAGSNGVLELVGNNSASYGNPNGNGIEYLFRDQVNLLVYREVVVWARAQGITPNDVSLVIGFGAHGGGYHYSTSTRGTVDGWSEIIFTLDQVAHPMLNETNAMYLVYITPKPTGYTQLWISSVYAEKTQPPNEIAISNVFTLLNVEYIFVDGALADRDPAPYYAALQNSTLFKQVFSAGNATVYQNLKWSQAFYTTTRSRPVGTTSDLVKFLVSVQDPHSEVLLSSSGPTTRDAPPPGTNTATLLTPVSSSPTMYVFNIASNGTFYLVLAQSFSNGWVAEINDSVVSTHFLANLYANGWSLPGGSYRLVLKYSSQQVYSIGIFVSASSTISVLALLLWSLSGSKLGDRVRRFVRAKMKSNVHIPASQTLP
jgi:hypothetical protein